MITVEQLSYAYPGGLRAVREVSFQVNAGEVLGFLGPSGAGKSTTQKVLVGLLSPYQGEVHVLGRSLRGQGPEYYEQIGVGFELPNHFAKLTALENLRFFASFYARTTDPRELLARVGLADAADQRVEQFSKGMKMRLNFVRAMLHDPPVLFLDEPTSGLDPANARLLKDIIVEQREQGKCIFLTTHNMHDAEEVCDRVAFMVGGEIRRIGPPKELRAQSDVRRVSVAYREDGEVRTAEFPLDGIGDDVSFRKLLREREIVSLHSLEPSLEDVFLQVTGRRLT
ncbi:MAG: ATP-binding cassette domain-containing protein [Actinophytocola sp.]|uniref:ABC transporter ATP-binding protein n=1 Tax=Actinophytocola sp. TaxID=1872138 RepID=UPI00132428C9|nr:ABC transporter ATP-binding protein [Actinophytocola sp.]MPZ78885.1 ATP-binding cassette domain-containing protein [Actinophytocola sp.]